MQFTFGDLNNLSKVMTLNLTLRICLPCSCRFSKGILYEFVCLCNQITYVVASLVAQSAKNLPAMQEIAFNTRDPGSIPGLGRSLGIGNSSPLQYSCLGNPMNREAWWALVHGVARVWHNLATKPLPLSILPKCGTDAVI